MEKNIVMDKQKLILIYNWHCQEEHWIPKQLENRNYEIVIIDLDENKELNRGNRFFRGGNLLRSFQLASKALGEARNGDIIVSMTSTPGVCCAFLAKYRKVGGCKILALNMLAHWGSGNKCVEHIRDQFYKKAFQNRNLWTTVNIKNEMDVYKNKLGISEDRIFLLPDAIENFGIKDDFQLEHDYIFSGGTSERDWKAVVYCASKLPNEKFVVVANKKFWSEDTSKLDNLKIYFDTSEEEFGELLNNSKMVLLTVKEAGVAGLMVLFQAIRNGKIFVATDTEAIRTFAAPSVAEYVLYPAGENQTLLDKISMLLNLNEGEKKKMIRSLRMFALENYSEEQYIKRMEKMFWTMKETCI